LLLLLLLLLLLFFIQQRLPLCKESKEKKGNLNMPRKTRGQVLSGRKRKPHPQEQGTFGGGKGECQGIKFASWNICRGLHSKEQELRQILDKAQTDVVFSTGEIYFVNYSSQQLNLLNFKMYVHEWQKKEGMFSSQRWHI
jgi:hypothetical protein